MQSRRAYPLALLLTLASAAGCNGDDDPAGPAPRVLTSVSVSIVTRSIEVGQLATAIAVGLDQDGAPIATGPASWTSDQPTVAPVNPTSGALFGISPGTTRIRATIDGKSGEQAVTVATAAAIRINEIQPRAETPTGWLEFFNPTAAAVSMAGWTLIDSNFFGTPFTFPAGTTIPAGGFLVVEEATLPFGVDATDNLHLFSRFGVQVDATLWVGQPATTYGHCPDGAGTVVPTTAATKGTANACPAAGSR